MLGFFYRIVLARELGAQGMGLLSMVQPVLFFAITLATAGLPVAISKIVAERAAVRPQSVRNVVRICLGVVAVTSVVFTAALIPSAHFISTHFLADPRSYYPLIIMVPLLSIIAVSVVYRGYFMGLQHMLPSALSQVLEQVVRIGAIVAVLPLAMKFGLVYGVMGAAAAGVVGEAFGLGVLMVTYRFHRPPVPAVARAPISAAEVVSTLRELFTISLPVMATRLVGALTEVADAAIIPRRLEVAGFSVGAATAYFGALYGMAVPLLFFPTVITFALAQNLVPAISNAQARQDWALVRRRSDQALELGMIVSLPATVVFVLFGHTLGLLFYGQRAVGDMIVPLALSAPFLYLEVSVSAVLRGLGMAATSTVNGLWGSFLRLAVVYTLTANPMIGPSAVLLGISLDLALSFALNFAAMVRATGLSIPLGRWLLRPGAAAALLLISLRPIQHLMIRTGFSLWQATLGALFVGAVIYLGCLALLGADLTFSRAR